MLSCKARIQSLFLKISIPSITFDATQSSISISYKAWSYRVNKSFFIHNLVIHLSKPFPNSISICSMSIYITHFFIKHYFFYFISLGTRCIYSSLPHFLCYIFNLIFLFYFVSLFSF